MQKYLLWDCNHSCMQNGQIDKMDKGTLDAICLHQFLDNLFNLTDEHGEEIKPKLSSSC